MTFGRDPNTGGGFMTVRIGAGEGGGISYDPNGGRPGSDPSASNTGGVSVGIFGEVTATGSLGGGGVNATVGGGAGNIYNNNAPNGSYGDFTKSGSIGAFTGPIGARIEAAGGIEISIFSRSDSSMSNGGGGSSSSSSCQ